MHVWLALDFPWLGPFVAGFCLRRGWRRRISPRIPRPWRMARWPLPPVSNGGSEQQLFLGPWGRVSMVVPPNQWFIMGNTWKYTTLALLNLRRRWRERLKWMVYKVVSCRCFTYRMQMGPMTGSFGRWSQAAAAAAMHLERAAAAERFSWVVHSWPVVWLAMGREPLPLHKSKMATAQVVTTSTSF